MCDVFFVFFTNWLCAKNKIKNSLEFRNIMDLIATNSNAFSISNIYQDVLLILTINQYLI